MVSQLKLLLAPHPATSLHHTQLRLPQQSDSFPNFPFPQTPIPQHESHSFPRLQKISRNPIDSHPLRRRLFNHFALRHSPPRPQHYVRPRSIPAHFHRLSQMFLYRLQQRLPQPRIPPPHPPQMPLLHPRKNNLRQRLLLQHRRVTVAHPLRRRKRRNQPCRRNQISNSQRREHRPRKRPHINHAPLAVQSLQRLDRLPLIPKLPVIIVLHYHCIRLPRPLQQRQPPPHRQNRPSRKLVRRRHKRHSRLPRQFRCDNSVPVHRHHRQPCSRGSQNFRGALISRIL